MDFGFPGPTPSLSIHGVRTLRSWRASHTFSACCIAMVGLTRKSFDGLAFPTMLRTRLTRVYGVVGTHARGQNSASSSRLCFLSFYKAVRLTPVPRVMKIERQRSKGRLARTKRQ